MRETLLPATRRTGLTGLEQRVLTRYKRLPKTSGTRLIVGFSGGPDSLALAEILARIARFTVHDVVLAHIDHGLRPSSHAEAQTAAASARALGLRFVAHELEGSCVVRHPHVGLEEAARRDRYAALARIAGEGGTIALAHHQSDQAETVLLHLLRGAGLRGASGMGEWTEVVIPWWQDSDEDNRCRLNLWRPLISESRALVRAYSMGFGLDAVQDPSNEVPNQTRNALRLRVFPELECIQPGATAALARYGELAALDDNHLGEETAKDAVAGLDDAGGLRIQTLQNLSEGMALRLIREWLATQHPGVDLSSERAGAVRSLALRGTESRTIQIGGDVGVVVIDGSLHAGVHEDLLRVARRSCSVPLLLDGQPHTLVLNDPAVVIDGWSISWLRDTSASSVVMADRHWVLGITDSSMSNGALTLRNPEEVDYLLEPTMKLSDYLKRRRLHPFIRADVVCLSTSKHVLGVIGLEAMASPREPGHMCDSVVVAKRGLS